MPTHITEMFFYDNIYFENGHKDKNQHPVVIAGADEENLYCFAMTSRTKHTGKNGYSRNIYNQNIKYVSAKPGKNCHTNNSIEGLINTTNCIKIPKTKAKNYALLGIASQTMINEIILRWAFQQNEINDQKDYDYDRKAQALEITDSITTMPAYRQLIQLMSEHKNELQNQRQYAKELRIYREEYTKIKRVNINRYYNGQQPLKYPSEPTLPYDKGYFEQFSTPQITEEERIKNSPFAGLSEQLFGKAHETDIEEKKAQLIELKNFLQNSQNDEQKQDTHNKKAA